MHKDVHQLGDDFFWRYVFDRCAGDKRLADGELEEHTREHLGCQLWASGRWRSSSGAETMGKLVLPTWLLPPLLNIVMLLRLRQNGVLKNFRARPFAK